MNGFKQYRRTQIAEMRPVTSNDIVAFKHDKLIHSMRDTEFKVSISDVDKANGSPKIGDMIARNPWNHNDQWLVAEQYFKDNFEAIDTVVAEVEKPLPTEQFAEIIERLWKDYRLVTNNEDSWCFKNWLVERVRIESTLLTEKCDVCGCHPSILIRTSFGTFCQEHAKY